MEQVNVESNAIKESANLQQHVPSTALENVACTSTLPSIANSESKVGEMAEKTSYDQLPKEMHEMKIRDEKASSHDEKVSLH